MIILSLSILLLIYLSTLYVGRNFAYEKAYWFYETTHFLGGFFVAMLISNFNSSAQFIVIGTFIVGLLWEAHELIIERSAYLSRMFLKIGIKQNGITFWDTALDIALDTIGALVFCLVLTMFRF